MKVSELIKYVRIELKDEIASRWKDEVILAFLKRALARASFIIHNNGIELGKAFEEIEVLPGQKEYELPYDFMTPIALFNGSTQLTHRTLEQFNQIEYAEPTSNFIIFNDQIWIMGVPTTATTLKFYYFTLFDPNTISLTSETPWAGKLDWLLIEYLALRAKNVNENDISVDIEMLKDFENQILNTYATIDPIVVGNRGWM